MIKLTNLDVKKMTIGQMARMNHISEQTLRLYDREGLLSPLGRDEKNGYRYYDIRQSAQLDMIQYMKALGMPLKEIRVHMKKWDTGRLKQLLVENRDAIDRRIEDRKGRLSGLWTVTSGMRRLRLTVRSCWNIFQSARCT